MEFKDIISISGMPGLFSLVSSKNNGIVVKSLEDGKSQFVSSRIHGVSTLDNISVYLQNEETTELKKVLQEMQKKEPAIALPDAKNDPKLLRDYFKKIIPDFDEEKVHISDIKKMVKWYHLLKEHNLIPVDEEKVEAAENEEQKEKQEGNHDPEEKKEN